MSFPLMAVVEIRSRACRPNAMLLAQVAGLLDRDVHHTAFDISSIQAFSCWILRFIRWERVGMLWAPGLKES